MPKINIASWFAAYRLLESVNADLKRELRREQILRRLEAIRAKQERQKLVDALAKARGQSAVFAPQPAPVRREQPAVGPMGAQKRDAEREREREALRQPVPEAILVEKASGNGR